MSLPVPVNDSDPAAKARSLTKSQKAAVIVHLLLREGADPGVARLSSALQRRLAKTLSSVGQVDKRALAAVASEFASQLDGENLLFPKDLRGAIRALDGVLSPNVVSDLASEMTGGTVDEIANSSWDALAAMDVDSLTALLRNESPEVIAIALSKLKPVRAAAVMQRMDPDKAIAISIAFASTTDVPTDTVSRIGLSLSGSSSVTVPKAFVGDPAERVGAILNAATSSDRARVLDALDETMPPFAARVRSAVFSWENIPDRMDPRDVPRILREIENDTIMKACNANPNEKVAAFLLSSISKRLAAQMREQMEEGDRPKGQDVEEARIAIAAAIRAMEERGELVLLTNDETDDDV